MAQFAESQSVDVHRLPYVDEHSRRVDASPDQVWAALSRVLRRDFGGTASIAWVLACEPAQGTAEFTGRLGETLPGFRVIQSEPGRRLVLRGRHRFSTYELTFVLDGDQLRAETHAAFPGLLGRCYRAAVVGSGGHRIIVRRLLRRISRALPR